MTHPLDSNVLMDTDPALCTDVFGFLMGEEFVMLSHEDSAIDNVLRRHCRIGAVRWAYPIASVAGEVRALEGNT
jgi:hypothetical protein